MRYAETKGLSPLEEQGARDVGALPHRARDRPASSSTASVDWVIKHKLIEAYRDKHDLPLSHPRVALIDLQYHDVNRDRGPVLPDAGTAAWSSA